MKPLFAALCVAFSALAGCSSALSDADRAELDNIRPWNVVPRASAAQLVSVFDQFCVSGPRSPAGLETALRRASYVPTGVMTDQSAQLFLVDDRRPAVAITERSCMVMARARTGQTQRVNDYIAATFPKAQSVAPSRLSQNAVEQAWRTPLGIVATTRHREIDTSARYGVLLMRPNT